MPKAPATLNGTDLLVIEALCQVTAQLNTAKFATVRDICEVVGCTAVVTTLRAILSEVGFDSDGIDELLDR